MNSFILRLTTVSLEQEACSIVVKDVYLSRLRKQATNLNSEIRRRLASNRDFRKKQWRFDALTRLISDIKTDKVSLPCHEGFEPDAARLQKIFEDILTT